MHTTHKIKRHTIREDLEVFAVWGRLPMSDEQADGYWHMFQLFSNREAADRYVAQQTIALKSRYEYDVCSTLVSHDWDCRCLCSERHWEVTWIVHKPIDSTR